jgi:RNA polymerase sigma-70 factor, ECF subfamily
LSALIRDLGDLDLAEEVLQEAFATSLVEWAAGEPKNPRGWLYTAERHNAIVRLRRRARFAGIQTDLAYLANSEPPATDEWEGERTVPDEDCG